MHSGTEDNALKALHAAAKAIKELPGIAECTVDNDHKSGEVIFKTKAGQEYILRLEEL